jgi:hypothetical protein
MLESAGGLVVTEAEHMSGWGRAQCFDCHDEAALHRVACAESVDLDGVRAEVDSGGEGSCSVCHGGNGVDP